MLRYSCCAVVLLGNIAGACRAATPAEAKEPVAVFHVGNSLTDQAYGMHDIAKARGHQTKFGRHMIPGAPLDWLWNHRGEGMDFEGRSAQRPGDFEVALFLTRVYTYTRGPHFF